MNKSEKNKIRADIIFETIKLISVSSNGDEEKIKFMAMHFRSIIMGIKPIWTGLFSKDALSVMKEHCGKCIPGPKVLSLNKCTLDHYKSISSIMTNAVLSDIKSPQEALDYIKSQIVLTCVTRNENSKLVRIQNKNILGYQSYEEYKSVLGDDLYHLDGTVATKKEIETFFS